MSNGRLWVGYTNLDLRRGMNLTWNYKLGLCQGVETGSVWDDLKIKNWI